MNKLTIPTILVATVMVAGMFAFMPVDQASTVHATSALATVEVLTFTDTYLTTGTDVYTLTCTGDALVNNIYVQQLPANDGDTSDLTVSIGTTTSGAAGLLAASDADAAISLAIVFDVPLEAGEVLTMTTAGTADGNEGDLDIFAVVTRAAGTSSSITETA